MKKTFTPFRYVFVAGGIDDIDILLDAGVETILISYAFLFGRKHVRIKYMFQKILDRGGILMLDSGAFSAFKSGVAISIDEYVAFVRKFHDYISLAVNLDVIRDGKATDENWKKFRSELGGLDGLSIMSVYHDLDGWSWYKKMLKDGNSFVGIAAGELRYMRARRIYLDRIFRAKGPQHKIHGFAMTDARFLFDLPFYSADSSTWAKMAGFGSVTIPELDFTPVIISERRLKAGRGSTGHLCSLPPAEQEMAREGFNARGFSYEQLESSPTCRRQFNILCFRELEAKVNDYREERGL